MEYFYIDFNGTDICSWYEGSDPGEYQKKLDEAYKLTGNYFKSFTEAEDKMLEILMVAGSPSIKSRIE